MLKSLLIANRGEIAARIIRTANSMGIRTIAVYSDADRDLPYVDAADESIRIGPEPSRESYLNVEAMLNAVRLSGAQAVHPGYGFLAENADFARRVEAEGIIWVGPTSSTMEQVSDKINARNLMSAAKVPVAAGTRESIDNVDVAAAQAQKIGYPLIVKPSGGGGGIGMTVVRDEAQLRAAFDTAVTRATRFFGDGRILLERYIPLARHVEVQILGLNDGRIIAFGERDCSVQRRHQKVAEESPSPGLSDELRSRMIAGAIAAGVATGYRNAGTIECLVDPETQDFVFLEMNTRLQVEHPVTEAVHGIDLVEAQLRIAGNEPLQFDVENIAPSGHAFEFRICAEDPERFLPAPGTLTAWSAPTGDGIRVDAGYRAGNTVSRSYDPLLAKLIVRAPDRHVALARARDAIADFVIEGVKTNLPFLAELLARPEFISGDYDTSLVDRMRSS